MDCTPEQIRRSAEDCQAKKDFDANFSLIYECLLPKIRRFFESKNIPRDIAEELSQEVFIRVFKRMGEFRDEAPFEAWVYVIAKRMLVDHWRGQNAKKRAGEKGALPLHGGGDGDRTESRIDVADDSPWADLLKVAIDKDRTRLLDEAMMSLPEQRRKCVYLSRMGYAEQEIAVLLNLAKGTVSSHLHAARRQMRAYLISRYGESNI